MSATDELVANNESYAARFEHGGLPVSPAKKVAVLACMDARLNPFGILGLREGDAHVIRNAGGVVTDDTIRSLTISQHLLGTEEVILLHHTDCGMLTFTDEQLAQKLEDATGQRPDWPAQAFADLAADVRESIEKLRQSPFLPHKNVTGFIYDVETGRLDEVG